MLGYMDVRVKFPAEPKRMESARQEIITGLPNGSVRNLLEVLSSRHPELASVFKEVDRGDDLRIFVNNDPVPTRETRNWVLRDGDTVSLFLPPK